MAGLIKVLIADDVAETRLNISKLISFCPQAEVIGEASDAQEAITAARQLQPDIILMDINMPGMDGITATEILSTELPDCGIIIISVQNESEYLKRAMIAGAKNYLTKPFTGDELINAITKTYESTYRARKNSMTGSKPCSGKIVTVFSTKGGIGKTTIATNLAVAIAEKTNGQVCILDADLQFGDVSLFLNIIPQATVADLVKDMDHLDDNLRGGYLTDYSKRLKVLPAPLRPEQADNITAMHLTEILNAMRTMFQYIIVDTCPSFSDAMLAVLDASDEILVVSALDLPTIKNVKLCLEIMDSLEYCTEKIKLVLNRANTETGVDVNEAEKSLGKKFTLLLPSDGKIVVSSVNKGIPFVLSNPETEVARGIFELAGKVSGEKIELEQPVKNEMMSKFKRLFKK